MAAAVDHAEFADRVGMPVEAAPAATRSPEFSVVVVGRSDRRIVTAHGELFAAGGQLLQGLVAQFVRDCAQRVRLDLREVTAVDLDGLHAVSSMRDALRAAGAVLMITNATRPVSDVFRLFSDLCLGPPPAAVQVLPLAGRWP